MAGTDYLQKMRELLEEAGGFTEEEIQEIIKVARGYAGGVASGRARQERAAQVQRQADLLKSEMAFRYDAIGDLPEGVRSVLPSEAQEIFLGAFNGALEDDDNEARAMAVAWTAVKKAGFHKGRDGDWRKGQEDMDAEAGLMQKMMAMMRRMLSMVAKLGEVKMGAEDSLDEQSNEVRGAWQMQHPSPMQQPILLGSWVKEVFADHIIVEDCGRLYSVPYSRDSSTMQITFGEPAEVKMQYVPIEGGEWLAVASDGKRFSELPFEFMAPPESIQVLPRPGVYSHPKYGEIEITAADLKEFVANFKANVYGQDAPIEIDFEHREGDLSKRGAVGYVRSLKPIDGFKGGVEAEVEWTKRGEDALKADAYKCFSPEWYDEWKHPTTGEVYHNVLIGGALTTRPFFKDDALAPLQASEDGERRIYLRQSFAVKTDDGVEYPAEAYLVVPDPDAPSGWKLRVWESLALKVTRAQLGRAAAALGPGGFRGQRVQLSPQERAAAITKLRQLYKSLDVPDDEIPRQIRASLAMEGVGRDEIGELLREFGMPDVDDVHVPGMVKFRKGGMKVEIKLTEEQMQALKEGKDLVLTEDQLSALAPKEASERLAATEKALHEASERLEAMEKARASEQSAFRNRRFTEIVQGRGQGTAFDGPAFVGETEKHVAALEILADAKGEDSEPFKDYVQMQQAHAEQIRASDLFTEAGHPGNGAPNSAEEEVNKRAVTIGGDFGAAVVTVLKADPVLARRYSEERNRNARIK